MTIKEYEEKLEDIDNKIKFYADIDTDLSIGMINMLEQRKDDLIISQLPF